MVDICGDNSSTLGNLLTHKLRRYMCLDAKLLTVHIFAYCDILHFWGDNAPLGVVHLSNIGAIIIPAFTDPLLTQMRQTSAQINIRCCIAIRARSVVDIDIGVGALHSLPIDDFYRRHLTNLAHTHSYGRVYRATHIDLLGVRVRNLQIHLLHLCLL